MFRGGRLGCGLAFGPGGAGVESFSPGVAYSGVTYWGVDAGEVDPRWGVASA